MADTEIGTTKLTPASRSTRRYRRGIGAVATLAAVLSLAGCGGTTAASSDGPVANLSMHDGDGMNGVVLTKPYTVPDVALTDTEGAPFSLARDPSKPVTLVFFGYTHCPDICQVVMADIASAMTRLDDDVRKQVGMVFVTTDPARDDRATLRSYLDRFDPTFEGLTGPLPRIVTVANALGVPIEKGAKMPSGGYEVAHGTQIVGLDDAGTAPIVWTEGTASGRLAQDITKLVDNHGAAPGANSGSTS